MARNPHFTYRKLAAFVQGAKHTYFSKSGQSFSTMLFLGCQAFIGNLSPTASAEKSPKYPKIWPPVKPKCASNFLKDHILVGQAFWI